MPESSAIYNLFSILTKNRHRSRYDFRFIYYSAVTIIYFSPNVSCNGDALDGSLVLAQKIDTIHLSECGILHSKEYTRSKKRSDSTIRYLSTTNSTCYGQIEKFKFNGSQIEILVSDLEVLELPYKEVQHIMKCKPK